MAQENNAEWSCPKALNDVSHISKTTGITEGRKLHIADVLVGLEKIKQYSSN